MALHETRGEPAVELPPTDNLTTRLFRRAEGRSTTEIVRYWSDGAWRGLTWAQLADRVREVAAGLVAVGVEPGDRVALVCGTRLEWTVSDLAILAAGAVTVPMYETSSVDQCTWILADSKAKVAIAETADHGKILDAARGDAPDLGEVFVVDDGGLQALAERADGAARDHITERAAAPRADDLASIVYTSGTTGNPKGCMLTHGNWLWTARQSEVTLRKLLGDEDATLLFLPLAHSFARLIQFLCLESDVTMGYSRGVEHLVEDLQSFSPTFLLSVPRVFEKVFNGARAKATGGKRKVFDAAADTAQAWSSSTNPGLGLKLRRGLFDRLVYAKLREAIGGRINYCVSGGAPLSPYLANFFHAAGITILEGYGLTETSAPATVNTPDALRIGSVGRPLPGVTVRVDDDGEILVSGGNVFAGYYHNVAATKEVLSGDGWLRTGDLGEIDDDGFLRITGRKKEIIVTAGGKNVAPAVLEERLKSNRLVSQCMVIGDNRPFIAALVTLDPEELTAFAGEQDLSGSPAELVRTDPVKSEVAKAIAHANVAVSKAESIRKFSILERDFTQEDAELTPTLKVKRRVITEHFATEIEALYEQRS
ncbi:MAG: AMP-dependent synthetase/ligase [Egibacteraceae bacterium]